MVKRFRFTLNLRYFIMHQFWLWLHWGHLTFDFCWIKSFFTCVGRKSTFDECNAVSSSFLFFLDDDFDAYEELGESTDEGNSSKFVFKFCIWCNLDLSNLKTKGELACFPICSRVLGKDSDDKDDGSGLKALSTYVGRESTFNECNELELQVSHCNVGALNLIFDEVVELNELKKVLDRRVFWAWIKRVIIGIFLQAWQALVWQDWRAWINFNIFLLF